MNIVLTSLEATARLARALAACVDGSPFLPPVLMHGPLGAGKTTFVRELVQVLPGHEKAEVRSPSFTLLTLYPTDPPVGHFDLYRTAGQGFSADLEETLLAPDHLCLVEWAEHLPQDSIPESFIEMTWTVQEESRSVELAAHGREAQTVLDCVQSVLEA
jgi:tRNA threonylcarbamoyladenosine biosynthesis protein TsaE